MDAGFSSLDLKQVGLHFFSKTATATITTFCEHALRCAVQFEKATENSPSECLFACFFFKMAQRGRDHLFRVELNTTFSCSCVFMYYSLAIPDITAAATTTTTPLERLISYYDRVFSLTTLLYPQTFCVKHQACCEHYSYICKKVRGGGGFVFSSLKI